MKSRALVYTKKVSEGTFYFAQQNFKLSIKETMVLSGQELNFDVLETCCKKSYINHTKCIFFSDKFLPN